MQSFFTLLTQKKCKGFSLILEENLLKGLLYIKLVFFLPFYLHFHFYSSRLTVSIVWLIIFLFCSLPLSHLHFPISYMSWASEAHNNEVKWASVLKFSCLDSWIQPDLYPKHGEPCNDPISEICAVNTWVLHWSFKSYYIVCPTKMFLKLNCI